ncbi:tRNA uracil 4-sulfurtransferase ThiI [uncultured Treponema sp.]|uniref:tRNA uracil 4-sulfurtransferase ThiI n=1 Tax=uncultured Treponema sp. TaxID=162155 RepID=UPI0025D82C7C|nr:tRNA uracil 4-sulfurtransferase ThiI [uncultured Treponema sp.]
MVTYLGKLGELTLKGSNLKSFEKLLVQNAKSYLLSVEAKVHLNFGRLYIECDESACPAVEFALDHLTGITGWAKAEVCGKNIESIQKKVLELAESEKKRGAKTFKIEAKRSDKSFELDSYGIMREAGNLVYEQKILDVDVHSPDVVFTVEVRDKVYVYSDSKKGCRGLPVGCSGKGLLLLSGGLDSPVAGYRMIRRGMTVECVYFHSYPYTSEEAQKKVEKLAEIVSGYGIRLHLNTIPFTKVQMQIKKKSPENYTTLMLRMCMMKVATMLAKRIGADCLITGESLGQVASQTVENMAVTESACGIPLLRPLVGLDKEEIIATAREIGTYETSILPYEDCCVLFSPKHPVLRAPLDEARKIFNSLEADSLIEEAFNNRELMRFEAAGFVAQNWGTKENTEKLSKDHAVLIPREK